MKLFDATIGLKKAAKGLNFTYFRQTPIRLTLVFLAVYALVAFLVSLYIVLATRTEATAWGNVSVEMRLSALQKRFQTDGVDKTLAHLNSEDAIEWIFAKGAFDEKGQLIAKNLRTSRMGQDLISPIIKASYDRLKHNGQFITMTIETRQKTEDGECCRFQGRVIRLRPDLYLFVAMDMSWSQRGYEQLSNAIWGGAILVLFFGLLAGSLINHEVTRSVNRVTTVLESVRDGDLSARIAVRASGDEFDTLSDLINQVLERMEKTVGNLKYAGDSIAHDLRSPLSRLRTKLDVSRKTVVNEPDRAVDIIDAALSETDNVLKTFQTVFSITRLQSAHPISDPQQFSLSDLCSDLAELFEAAAEDKGIEFHQEITPSQMMIGHKDFLAQAVSNLLDNALKYTPSGGGVTLRLRKNRQGESEISVTDNGPGVPFEDRARIIDRFVRLEQSRHMPGVGLGLSMVSAVATAHAGKLVIDEGPGLHNGFGPGLRVALVLPSVTKIS